MIKTQILILAELASKDGEFHPRELEQIQKIARAHGLSKEEVEKIIEEAEPTDWTKFDDSQRFDLLQNVVLLMKSDGQIFDEEIMFCMEVAKRLGYPLEAVMELYSVVHANLKMPDQLAKVKRKYFNTPS